MENAEISKEKLAADLRVVVADAEELLRATASQAGDKVAAARVKIQESLDSAKGKLANLGEAGVDKAKAAARVTDDFVHERPWTAVGIGAGIGLILGMLIMLVAGIQSDLKVRRILRERLAEEDREERARVDDRSQHDLFDGEPH